jgi:hypothetical protein
MAGSNWRAYAELIGIAAIVASLIFVGLQLKQSQEIAIAGQYQERFSVASDYFNTGRQDDWLADFLGLYELEIHPEITALLPGSTPTEIGRAVMLMEQLIVIYDNHHFQFEAGFMTDEAWQQQESFYKTIVTRPEYHHFMLEHTQRFRQSFLEYSVRLRESVLQGD